MKLTNWGLTLCIFSGVSLALAWRDLCQTLVGIFMPMLMGR